LGQFLLHDVGAVAIFRLDLYTEPRYRASQFGQAPTWGGRRNDVSASNPEKITETACAKLCRERGWVCKVCGAVPALGKQFDADLCDDCTFQLKNE